MEAVDERQIQKSRGQEASTSNGAGTPSFQDRQDRQNRQDHQRSQCRTRMNYPFDQRFIFAVENIDIDENAWLCLIRNEGQNFEDLMKILSANGYTKLLVQTNIANLIELDTDTLITLAGLPDYRSEPALAVLKTRATEEVFNKAACLSNSSLNTKRILSVKILSSPYQKAFVERAQALLNELNNKETDELVIEQLGYAFSRLRID